MKCEILLSTYNGEKFLTEQIESILAQTVETHITARDDGSTDSTNEILKTFKDISVIHGTNIGATESFLELLKAAPESEYYAFSDQDDVWDKDKLERAITMIKKYDSIPAIYSSNTRLVDENLKLIKIENKKVKTNLGSAIVKNYATGCTVVINRMLMDKIKKYRPVGVPFHDWWVNLVCLTVEGVSIFDKEPHINYRQHGNNVVSGNATIFKKWKARIQKFNKPYHRENMANQLYQNYKDMSTERTKEILEISEKYKTNKLRICMDNRFRTGSFLTDALFKICVVFNRA